MKNSTITVSAYLKHYLSKPNEQGFRTKMFLYEVGGFSKEELAVYKENKGDHYEEGDSGNPLWHSKNALLVGDKLTITDRGNLFPDDERSARINSILDQMPDGILKDKMAGEFARQETDRILRLMNQQPALDTVETAPKVEDTSIEQG